MPNQSHSGIQGIPWSRCDRCGRDYRLSNLQMQNGLLLCHDDFDEPMKSLPAIRDKQIGAFLANAEPEAANETAKRRANPNNVINQF